MGGCQNYGPILSPLNTRCRIILRTQKGTIILTTTHISIGPLLGYLEPQGYSPKTYSSVQASEFRDERSSCRPPVGPW